MTDATSLLQGKRVMVDFVFFSMAYLDSEAGVDGEFFALGAGPAFRLICPPQNIKSNGQN